MQGPALEAPPIVAPRWARGAAVALVLSAALPFEVDRGRPVFLWQAIRDIDAPAAVAALAPAVAGVLVGAAAMRRRPLGHLASIALPASAAVLLLGWIAGNAPAWDLLSLPSSWTAGSAIPVLGVALCAASIWARRASRGLLAAGAVLVALFYALPVSGEAPLRAIEGVLAGTRSGRPALPAVLLAAFLLWPAVIATVACARRSSREASPASVLALALPVVMLPMVYRSITGYDATPLWIPRLAGAAVVLGALIALLAGALATLAETRPRLVQAAAPLVVMLIVVAAQLVAATSTRAARYWSTGAGSDALDHLFGDLLPAWNDAQASGSDRGREEAARTIEAARAIDPVLSGALEALVRETADPDLTERRWYRLVDGVDEASRLASLPYYVDPTEIVVTGGDRAWFRVDTYRVREARTLHFGDRAVVALHLSAMIPARTNRDPLGLSRDGQPFALVALDVVDRYRRLVERLGHEAPPRCRDADRAAEDAVDPAHRCGELLRSLVAIPDLGATLVSMVERHEAQHQLDGPHLRRARIVRGRLDAYDPHVATRVNRELSAYLAQMMAPGAAPRLTVVRLVQLALGPKGVERLAAALALEALAGLYVEPQAAIGVLACLDDDGLRRRAGEAWERLYEERLPEQ